MFGFKRVDWVLAAVGKGMHDEEVSTGVTLVVVGVLGLDGKGRLQTRRGEREDLTVLLALPGKRHVWVHAHALRLRSDRVRRE